MPIRTPEKRVNQQNKSIGYKIEIGNEKDWSVGSCKHTKRGEENYDLMVVASSVFKLWSSLAGRFKNSVM